MDLTVRVILDEMHHTSDQLDQAEQAYNRARTNAMNAIKKYGLTNKKFAYGNKTFRYRSFIDYGQPTQTLIKKVITTHYPSINPEKFLEQLKSMREGKPTERIEITRVKK